MDVYAIGSEVLLDDAICARVTAIVIRADRISYEVVWWNERSREEAEVESWELRPDNAETKTLRVNPVL